MSGAWFNLHSSLFSGGSLLAVQSGIQLLANAATGARPGYITYDITVSLHDGLMWTILNCPWHRFRNTNSGVELSQKTPTTAYHYDHRNCQLPGVTINKPSGESYGEIERTKGRRRSFCAKGKIGYGIGTLPSGNAAFVSSSILRRHSRLAVMISL